MKVKQTPDDFEVEELTSLTPESVGNFAFYRLEKRAWTTLDSLAAIRRRWQIEYQRLSYGGLKDRHAHTIQYFSIFHGPRRGLEHHNVKVTYLGQIAEAYRSQHITANRFRLVIRDLAYDAIENMKRGLQTVQEIGLPNYFDDQRFGSVGGDGQFIARLLVLGLFEDALRLALTAPYEFDHAEQKKEKATLRRHWGDWPTCKEHLPRSHARSLVDYLVHHPMDYRGAMARLRPELRTLYLSAYQSHLWNRMLSLWLRRQLPAHELVEVPLQLGAVPMPLVLGSESRQQLLELQLPLPSARLKMPETDPRLAIVQEVLRDEGLELRQMQVRGLRELFFSKGMRDAWLRPANLCWEGDDDERHPGKAKCELRFDLPRGSYATLLVKRIMTQEPGPRYGPALH